VTSVNSSAVEADDWYDENLAVLWLHFPNLELPGPLLRDFLNTKVTVYGIYADSPIVVLLCSSVTEVSRKRTDRR